MGRKNIIGFSRTSLLATIDRCTPGTRVGPDGLDQSLAVKNRKSAVVKKMK